MKSTKDRDPLDRYYTPLPFARAHLRQLLLEGFLKDGMTVLDTGCGNAQYLRAARLECDRHGLKQVRLFGIDLDEAAIRTLMEQQERKEGPPGELACGDFLNWRAPVDLVVGNPPFVLAEKFIEHAQTVAAHTSYLLQSQFIAGAEKFKKRGLWRGLLRSDPFITRPKFFGPAIDLLNEARKKEAEAKGEKFKPLGGNAVDYSAFTWGRRDENPNPEFKGRHLRPITDDEDAARLDPPVPIEEEWVESFKQVDETAAKAYETGLVGQPETPHGAAEPR